MLAGFGAAAKNNTQRYSVVEGSLGPFSGSHVA